MTGITKLDTVPYLVQLNKIRKLAADYIRLTGVMEIRRRRPVLTGAETEAERARLTQEQISKNLDAILDKALEEHPTETAQLLDALIVYEDGEEHLKGKKLVSAGLAELKDGDIMSFFISLISAAPI